MTDASPTPAAPQRALAAVVGAIQFFTRAPTPGGLGPASFDGIASASPVAGALVGAGSGLALIAALAIGLPTPPAAIAATAVAVGLSGALHLDGLSDVADGFGGGATRERKLEIMRDSRLGTYGGAALVLALFARVALIAALADRLGGYEAALVVTAAAMLARPLAFLPAIALDPARADGLGRSARPGPSAVALGVGIGAAVTLALGGIGGGTLAVAFAAAAATGMALAARRQIGGYTGDVCGACAEVAEIAALCGLLAAAAP